MLSISPITFPSLPAATFPSGYSEIYFTPTQPTFLVLQCNVCVLDGSGACVGQLGKDLRLKFLGEFLYTLVTQSSLLAKGGRVFSYEATGLLTGASHGAVFFISPEGVYSRLGIWQSEDSTVATAGRQLRAVLAGALLLISRFLLLGDSRCFSRIFRRRKCSTSSACEAVKLAAQRKKCGLRPIPTPYMKNRVIPVNAFPVMLFIGCFLCVFSIPQKSSVLI